MTIKEQNSAVNLSTVLCLTVNTKGTCVVVNSSMEGLQYSSIEV